MQKFEQVMGVGGGQYCKTSRGKMVADAVVVPKQEMEVVGQMRAKIADKKWRSTACRSTNKGSEDIRMG